MIDEAPNEHVMMAERIISEFVAVRRARPLVTVGATFGIRYLGPCDIPANAVLIPLEDAPDDGYALLGIDPAFR